VSLNLVIMVGGASPRLASLTSVFTCNRQPPQWRTETPGASQRATELRSSSGDL